MIDGLPDTTSFPAQVANKIFSRVSNSCEVFFEREESPSRIQIVEVNPQEYLRNTYSNNNMKTIESREKLGGWEETKKQAPASRGILRCRPKNIGFMSMGQKRTTEKQNTNFVSFNVSRLNIRSNRHLS